MSWRTVSGTSALSAGLIVAMAALSSGGKGESASRPPAELPGVVRWKADGMVMVKVPAGPFIMGGTRHENEKPRRRVELPVYYIDRTEVTFRMYFTFCKETGRRPPAPFFKYKPFPQEMLSHPVSNVSWEDADAYCKWTGRRLPTEEEWEKACAGQSGRVYPWGNGWNASACTNRTNSNDVTTPAGARPSCKSPYGAMDMGGNLWEWTSDWYKSYPGADLTFDFTGDKKVVRGGAYFYSIDLLRCACRWPIRYDDASESSGFRCAVTPGPDFGEKTEAPGQ